MLVERNSFDLAGGFDESLRFGEGVDLAWRLAGLRPSCRNELVVWLRHRSRESLGGFHFAARPSRRIGSRTRCKGNPERLASVGAQIFAAVMATSLAGPGSLLASAGITAFRLWSSGASIEFGEAFSIDLAGELTVSEPMQRVVAREWLLLSFLAASFIWRWRFLSQFLDQLPR